MSTLTVRRQVIKEIKEHENADRLELATLEGIDYQFVVQKGVYHAGDEVIYFPIDSLLPQPLISAMGLDGKLSGKEKNRVKTVKLRGEISQGLVVKPTDIASIYVDVWNTLLHMFNSNLDMKELLGVAKYEPPEIGGRNADLVRMPQHVSIYDLENAENEPDIVKELMKSNVVVTEKIEGSNWWMTIDKDDNITVGQRRYALRPKNDDNLDTHTWIKVAHTMEDAIRHLFASFASQVVDYPDVRTLTLRGEIIGPSVQGNYYQLNKHKVLLFDIEINGFIVSPEAFFEAVETANLETVPLISMRKKETLEWLLKGQTLKQFSNRQSLLINKPAEGVVIRPLFPTFKALADRVIIKQRSPEYLSKSDS